MINKERFSQWYDRKYWLLAIIPIILVVLSLAYIGYFYSVNGNFINKDISLAGGTTITLSEKSSLADFEKTESLIKSVVPDVGFKRLADISSGTNIALIIESSLGSEELKYLVENALGYELTSDNSSIEFSGPSISRSFYSELLRVVLLSFILMGLVVFLIFGEGRFFKSLAFLLSFSAIRLTFPNNSLLMTLAVIGGASSLIYSIMKFDRKKSSYYFLLPAIVLFAVSLFYPVYYILSLVLALLAVMYLINSVPSIAVILAAFSNIVLTTAVMNFADIKISSAGLVAFLMLIGYSVDTDILLTNKVLRSNIGSVNSRIYGAFKTGIFMTLTALAAVLPAFLLITGLPDSFRQIFLVVSIGLFFDIINTWLTNTGIIKWYCKRKGIV